MMCVDGDGWRERKDGEGRMRKKENWSERKCGRDALQNETKKKKKKKEKKEKKKKRKEKKSTNVVALSCCPPSPASARPPLKDRRDTQRAHGAETPQEYGAKGAEERDRTGTRA